MEGDVTVRVEYSTVNYKDGLAVTGKAPVVRRFPMIAGIDFAGTVEASSHPAWKPGDKVIGNGWGMGETHLGAFAPMGYGQKHGHMNSAVFYVLRGRGYDVHDGVRLDYEAGDALMVENGCVHQHFNSDPNEEMVVLVMKAKPLFLFMHMIFQRNVKMPPSDAVPGQENYEAPQDL